MNEAKHVPDLKNKGFFEELPARRRRYLESKLKRIEFAPGTRIINQGRSGQFLGIVESGQVVLENTRNKARTLTTGQYFGSEMLRYGKPSAFTITAQTETIVWVLNRSDWLNPSPPPPPRIINSGIPRFKKAGWLLLVLILSLSMVVFILGPTLLGNTTTSLPNRLVEAGRPDLAEEYLRFVIRMQPESARFYGNLADNLVLQGKGQEAIEAYQQAITLDEYLPWIHNNLGVLLLEQDATDLAVYHFQAALKLNPQNTDAYRNLGNTYYTLEQWEAAANAYQRALDLDSTLLDTKAAWAGIILNENRLEDARYAWEEVLQENPRNPLALQGLGVVSLLEENPALALLYLDAARYIDPENPTTRLYIGLALEALDRPAEATAEYKYVVDMGSDPELYSLADTLLQVVQE